MVTARPAVWTSAVAVALLTLAVAGTSAAVSAADSGYRYWNFWVEDAGSWTLPEETQQERQLADASVDGWHFGVWGDDGGDPPRSVTSFNSLCPALAAGTAHPDTVRVAVVIDPGTADDAPAGQSPRAIRTVCLRLSAGSTSRDALERAATSVRIENNTVCAIDDYPRGECAPLVGQSASASPSSSANTKSSAPNGDQTRPDADPSSRQQAAWKRAAPIAMAVLGSALLVAGSVIALRRSPGRRRRN